MALRHVGRKRGYAAGKPGSSESKESLGVLDRKERCLTA
jgi:hypothetical protein